VNQIQTNKLEIKSYSNNYKENNSILTIAVSTQQ